MYRSWISSKSTFLFLGVKSIYLSGTPGEDYPIYSEVPETDFSCEGQVIGGYYADPTAECQVFHVCATDSADSGPNSKWSFLCPNGTIFNQNYFICDWWFNFDCSEAESLYGLNDALGGADQAQYGEEQAEYAADAGQSQGYMSFAIQGPSCLRADIWWKNRHA